MGISWIQRTEPDRTAVPIPPTRFDRTVEQIAGTYLSNTEERIVRLVTFLADEKLTIGISLGYWALVQLQRSSQRDREEVNHLLASLLVATASVHLVKRLVNRLRPDRTIVHGYRKGIPLAGNAWDSFPSGHAVQLGTLASALSTAHKGMKMLIWPAAILVAATRPLLLAHYPTDVAGGLLLGCLVERLMRRWHRFGMKQARYRPLD